MSSSISYKAKKNYSFCPKISEDFPVYTSAAVVLLVLSILVMLITFLGCCGAHQDSRCMLATVIYKQN